MSELSNKGVSDLVTQGIPRELTHFLKVDFSEMTLGLLDGTRVAVKSWGPEHADIRILALHGWLDNANSYDTLAPLLVSSKQKKIRLVAMDFLGHGLSSHLPKTSNYLQIERVMEVISVADALRWPTFVLIGHSMGGMISILTAGTIPTRVEKVIILDAFPGPLKWSKEDPAEMLERGIIEKWRLLKRQPRVYPSLEALLTKYKENNPDLKPHSAKLLVSRSAEEILVGGGQEIPEKGFVFRHDPRIAGRTIATLSERSVRKFLQRIACPVLFIFAKNSRSNAWQTTQPELVTIFNERMELIKNAKIISVEGSHHVHLDQPELVYSPILEFISQTPVRMPASKL